MLLKPASGTLCWEERKINYPDCRFWGSLIKAFLSREQAKSGHRSQEPVSLFLWCHPIPHRSPELPGTHLPGTFPGKYNGKRVWHPQHQSVSKNLRINLCSVRVCWMADGSFPFGQRGVWGGHAFCRDPREEGNPPATKGTSVSVAPSQSPCAVIIMVSCHCGFTESQPLLPRELWHHVSY